MIKPSQLNRTYTNTYTYDKYTIIVLHDINDNILLLPIAFHIKLHH